MSPLITRRLGGFLVLGFLVGLGAGCNSTPQPELRQGQDHIMRVMSLAQQFRTKHNRFPENADELKKWAQTLKPEELQKVGIENLETALVSPRDKQPYQFNKLGSGPRAKMGMMPVLVYEKEGVKGKHQVASSMGNFNELTREQLKAEVPAVGQ
jgi:hypothetical protein